MRRALMLSVVVALLTAPDASARGGGRGGGRGGSRGGGQGGTGRGSGRSDWGDMFRETMRWLPDFEAAQEASDEGRLPIMLYLRRAGEEQERRDDETLFSSIHVKRGSRQSFAAYRLDTLLEDGQAAAEEYGIKSGRGLVWLDLHGNRLHAQEGRITQTNILTTAKNWKYLIAGFERKRASLLSRGSTHFRARRYGSALDYLLKVADVQGPGGDEAREMITEIEATGIKLIEAAEVFAESRQDRMRLLNSIALDFKGTDVEIEARLRFRRLARGEDETSENEAAVGELLDGDLAALAGADDLPEAGKAVEGSEAGETDEAIKAVEAPPSDDAAVPEAPTDTSEVAASAEAPMIAAPDGAPAEGADPTGPAAETSGATGVQGHRPEGAPAAVTRDPANANLLYVQAKDLYRKGSAIYSRAMQRGTGANKEYAEAFKILTEALEPAEEAKALDPTSSKIEKLMERINVARYGCFKYQTL